MRFRAGIFNSIQSMTLLRPPTSESNGDVLLCLILSNARRIRGVGDIQQSGEMASLVVMMLSQCHDLLTFDEVEGITQLSGVVDINEVKFP